LKEKKKDDAEKGKTGGGQQDCVQLTDKTKNKTWN